MDKKSEFNQKYDQVGIQEGKTVASGRIGGAKRRKNNHLSAGGDKKVGGSEQRETETVEQNLLELIDNSN